MNYLNDWYKLNQREKNYLLTNPWHFGDIGPEAALEFTTAHEERPGLPEEEIEMDLFNN